jgi:glycerophosphoryl diester phosphodiesterase
MLVISHRGYHVDLPENTIEAFERALSMGVDGIETDVCLTVDGLPILFHDRVANDNREVSTLSRAGLEKNVGHPIATLEELEELILRSDPHILWDLEVKQPNALDATLALVSRLRDAARFLVTSFWHPVVLKAAAHPGIDCGLLVCHYPVPSGDPGEWFGIGSGIGTIVWSCERVDAALIREASRRGLRSFVYGAITPGDHARLAGWGVDGMITDHPEFLLPQSR